MDPRHAPGIEAARITVAVARFVSDVPVEIEDWRWFLNDRGPLTDDVLVNELARLPKPVCWSTIGSAKRVSLLTAPPEDDVSMLGPNLDNAVLAIAGSVDPTLPVAFFVGRPTGSSPLLEYRAVREWLADYVRGPVIVTVGGPNPAEAAVGARIVVRIGKSGRFVGSVELQS